LAGFQPKSRHDSARWRTRWPMHKVKLHRQTHFLRYGSCDSGVTELVRYSYPAELIPVVKPDIPLQLDNCRNLGPAELELLRLQCDGPLLLDYLQLLMSRSNAIPSGMYSRPCLADQPVETLQREVVELATKTSDLGSLMACCLRWIATRNEIERAGGFAVLVELLSIRRQGESWEMYRY